jgi:hypothetical protein
MYCDEVQVFLGIFQQIAPVLNRCTVSTAFPKYVFNKKNMFLN